MNRRRLPGLSRLTIVCKRDGAVTAVINPVSVIEGITRLADCLTNGLYLVEPEGEQ